MKAIIDGKTYNTETAEKLAEVCNPSAGTSDFSWWEEALYRTKRGAYFLAGGGGSLSGWAKAAIGGGRTGGSGIKRLSEEDARAWAERWLSADEYLELFEAEEA